MTGGIAPRQDGAQFWRLPGAAFDRQRASVAEGAACCRFIGLRLYRLYLSGWTAEPVDGGLGIGEYLCIRMKRPVEDLMGGAGLNDTPPIHHRDTVGDTVDDGEIVGDEQEGDATPLP